MKKQKDAAEAATARKRKRKEKHEKACEIAHAEGKPRPATLKASRPLIRVLVINDNGLWINDFI